MTKVRVSLDLEEHEHKELQKMAKEDDRSLNSYIRMNLVKKHLETQ